MLLCKFEWDKSVWNGFVLECLGLGVEEADVAGVQGVQNVLGCWHKLASLRVNHHDHLKQLGVVREVLDIVWQSDDADDELDERVHEQGQVWDLCIGQSKHPQFQAMVELPRVDVFEHVFGQVVADRAEMQAELANVLKAQLVADLSIDGK